MLGWLIKLDGRLLTLSAPRVGVELDGVVLLALAFPAGRVAVYVQQFRMARGLAGGSEVLSFIWKHRCVKWSLCDTESSEISPKLIINKKVLYRVVAWIT
jgi:hypothetical protein